MFATKGVHIDREVELHYPSSIYINNDDDENTLQVYIGTNSILAGGIVLTGDSYRSSLNRLVTIDESAKVIGDVYCYGKTQLKGKVIGTVYTERFYLKTAASIYENYIVNGEVNKPALPEEFIGLPLFITENSNYELIKEL